MSSLVHRCPGPRAITVVAVLLMLAQAGPLLGAEVSGRFSSLFQSRENRDGGRESVLDNYLSLDGDRLLHPAVSMHAYGKYGHDFDAGFSDTSLYYGYLEYRTHEGRADIKLGRFPLSTHRFLTVDGVNVSLKPDGPVGVAVFGGASKYLDLDPDRFKRLFSTSEGTIYGGRLFLQGIEDTRAYAGYSWEGSGDTVYQELFSGGVGRDFRAELLGKELKISADGNADYNVDRADLEKMSARLFTSYDKKLRVLLEADLYDVKNEFPEGRELVLSILSDGREERTFYTVFYDLNPIVAIYQSSVFTRLKMPDGGWQTGTILKGGVSGNFIEQMGLDLDLGIYRFESFIADATGISTKIRWRPHNKWILEGGLEAVSIDTPSRHDQTATTITGEVGYRPKPTLKAALFVEQSDNPEFRSDFRTGMRLDYDFSFSTGRNFMAGEGR